MWSRPVPDTNQTTTNITLRSQAMLVSPEVAHRWLEANKGNRPMRPSLVKHYAGSMVCGEWILSPQGVTFSTAGRLLDGQHRLAAVVKSGVSVWLYVTTGASDNTFTVLDQGAARTYADIAQLPKRIGSMRGYMARSLFKMPSPTVAQIETITHEIDAIAMEIITSGPTTRRSISASPALAAITLRAHQGHRDWVVKTYTAAVNLNFNALDPAPLSFLRQCIDNRAGLDGELVSRAWTAFDYAGRHRTKIQVKDPAVGVAEVVAYLTSISQVTL